MAKPKDDGPRLVTLRFTGNGGACAYVYDGGRACLRPGDTVRVVPRGHWRALLKTRNAEIVK